MKLLACVGLAPITDTKYIITIAPSLTHEHSNCFIRVVDCSIRDQMV